MRKNKIVSNQKNQTLGRELYKLIIEKLGGTAGKQDYILHHSNIQSI